MAQPDDRQERCGPDGSDLDAHDGPARETGMVPEVIRHPPGAAALRRSDELLRATLESIDDGLLVTSQAGRISHFNSRFLEIWSIPPELMTTCDDRGLIDYVTPQLVEPEQFAVRIQETYITDAKTRDTLQFKDGRVVERFSSPLGRAGEAPERMWLFRDVTARVRAEAALRDREARLSSIFRAAPVGIGVLVNRVIKEVNEALCRITGYDREELLGQSTRFLYPTDEEFATVGEAYRGVAKWDAGILETRWRRKDGTFIHVILSTAPLDARDLARGVTFTALDITERKRADEALRASQTLLSESQRIARIGSWELDLRTERLVWTDECFRICGFRPQEFQPTLATLFERVLPEDHPRLKAHHEEMLATRSFPPFECRIMRPDGQVRWLHVTGEVVCDAAGTPIKNVGTQQDITERRRAEEALRASEHKLAEIFRASPEFISVSTVEEGRFLEVNEAYTRLLGFRREEVVGHTSLEIGLWPSPADRDRLVNLVKERGQIQNVEARFHIKTGEVLDVLISMALITIQGQSCLITVATDISERKRAEEARLELERRLLHAQKLESLGVLAGGIAHDFNNLLMAILGNLDLALMELPAASPARANIEQSMLAAHRAADLTRQMLAYSGKTGFAVRSVDLSGVVEENVHLFRSCISKIVTFNLRLERGLPLVEADPGHVQQVIMNLITNASEAIGDQAGVISLSTGVQECDAIHLSHSRGEEIPPAGRFVSLEVTDTGCGMDQETQRRLFDPFFTTKFMGRGLGMAAILGIVRAHRGAIFVDSAVGQGTTIRVLFPAGEMPPTEREQGQAAEASPSYSAQGDRPEGTILVVDDEDVVRRVCTQMLEQAGWRVLAAVNGWEAIALFRQHVADIACVILDLSMPQMDGKTVYRELRAIKADVKVVLCSGYSGDQGAVRQLSEEGLAGFIQKPYTSQNLHLELSRVLQGSD